MGRDWLLCLLGLSVALTLSAVGTLIYFRHQAQTPRPPVAEPAFRDLPERLNFTPRQREVFERFFQEHRRPLVEKRRELLAKRRELFTLMGAEPLPEWPVLRGKLQEITELQARLEEEMMQRLLELQRHLDPEQRARMAAVLEQRFSRFPPGAGRMRGPRGRGVGPPPGPERFPPPLPSQP